MFKNNCLTNGEKKRKIYTWFNSRRMSFFIFYKLITWSSIRFQVVNILFGYFSVKSVKDPKRITFNSNERWSYTTDSVCTSFVKNNIIFRVNSEKSRHAENGDNIFLALENVISVALIYLRCMSFFWSRRYTRRAKIQTSKQT